MGQYKRYHLPTIFSNGDVLILNTGKGILTRLAEQEIIEQQILTDYEMYVIAELFENYPEYCPYEVLLSAQTNESVEKCREQIFSGLELGTFGAIMRPVRNTLSRCLMKLHPFGIEVTSLHETGYVLIPLERKPARRLTAEH
jgi:hypothetical protein